MFTHSPTPSPCAMDRSDEAALQLGYLIGAVRKGGGRTNGIHQELMRRVEQAIGLDGPPAPRRAAFDRGLAAGGAIRMKLRLYHHPDGARVAYREAGTGPPLALLHSAGLTHKEFEPWSATSTDWFRVVLPDLPGARRLRGPAPPPVLARLARRRRRRLLPGRARSATARWRTRPRAPTCSCAPGERPPAPAPSRADVEPPARPAAAAGRCAHGGWSTSAAAVPGLDRVMAHGARLLFRPELGASSPLVAIRRRATSSVTPSPTSPETATARARGPSCPRRWPVEARRPGYLDAYRECRRSDLLLWASDDRFHPLADGRGGAVRLPRRPAAVLPGTGFLMAYDDPVGLARELAASS